MQRDRAVVVQRVAADIDFLGVGGDHFAGHFADDLQNAAVVIDGVRGVFRRVVGVAVVLPREIVFLNPRQSRPGRGG